jgi:uncharacterized beta-barrel protein YwiB (DUF1934 family)
MTKEVLVTISGIQIMGPADEEMANEAIEVVAPAEYFCRNGKHYILYEEVTEGFKGHTKNQIKVSDGPVIQMKKSGLVNSSMVFEVGKNHVTGYQTPLGEMILGVTAKNILIEEQEDRMDIRIDYTLHANYEPLSECEIHIVVQSREKAVV